MVGSVLERALFKTVGKGDSRVKRGDGSKAMTAACDVFLKPVAVAPKPPEGKKVSKQRKAKEALNSCYRHVKIQGKRVAATDERVKQWREAILECAPSETRELLAAVLRQIFPSVFGRTEEDIFTHADLNAVLRLLDGLAPLVSVEAMLPRAAVPLVVRMIAYGTALLDPAKNQLAMPVQAEKDELKALCPEIFEVVSGVLLPGAATARAMFGPLSAFLLKLCDLVTQSARSDVAPPPFEAQEGTYSPPTSGIALQFSPSGERGRYTRDYDIPAKRQKEERDACKKDFRWKKKRTGGVFTFFCPHGFSYGTTLVMDHEGRRDPFQCLYTHMESAPAVIIYDFACQLAEYCRNREPAFFANTRCVVGPA
jgi:hypothetical protein